MFPDLLRLRIRRRLGQYRHPRCLPFLHHLLPLALSLHSVIYLRHHCFLHRPGSKRLASQSSRRSQVDTAI